MVCLVIRLDVNAGTPQVLVNHLSPNGSRARDGDLDIGEFVPKKPDRFGEPVDLLSGQEAQRERQFGGLSSASCRFASRIDLSQRQSGMVEKRPTRGGQLDAVSTANHQLRADLVLKVPDLTTE